MRSKTSSFNRTLFVKTISRFWPLWLIYFGVWFVALPLNLSSSMTWNADLSSLQWDILNVARWGGLIIGGITAALSAMAVFSFLYSSRSASGTACLPIRREGVFLSVTLAGILPLLAGNVLIFLVSLLFESMHGMTDVATLAQWLAMVSLQLLYYYGFAVFCAQLTGNILVLPAVYAVLNFTALAVETMGRFLCSIFLFGMSSTADYKFMFLSPPANMASMCDVVDNYVYDSATGVSNVVSTTFVNWYVAVIYAVVGIALAVAGLFIYRRRRMETAGDVVAIRFLRPVFKYCMTGGCALCLGALFFSISGLVSMPVSLQRKLIFLLLFLLLGAFIGYFASEMLIRKSFRVWRHRHLGFGVACVVILAVCLGVRFDPLGYAKSVPKAENVAGVRLDFSGYTSYYIQPDNISDILALHTSIASNADTYQRRWSASDGYFNWTFVRITYDLTGGGQLCREYQLSYDSADPASYADVLSLQTLANTGEAIIHRYEPRFPLTEQSIESGSVASSITPAQYVTLTGETPQTSEYESAYNEKYATDGTVYAEASDVSVAPSTTLEYEWAFTSGELYELYSQCILPDLKDGTLGRIQLLPDGEADAPEEYAVTIYIDARQENPDYTTTHHGDPFLYSYFSITPTVDSARTVRWLTDHGVVLNTRSALESLSE